MLQDPKIWGFIPARLESKRLPNKPLLPIGDAPLIWQTYLAAQNTGLLSSVMVVSDSEEICDALWSRRGQALIMDGNFQSGTERVAAAAALFKKRGELCDEDLVLNIQGDEPFLDEAALSSVITLLKQGASIATLSTPISESDLPNPSAVKVVFDRNRSALYFSRAPIPGQLHIGIYGFRLQTLLQLAHCPKGPLALRENLEQLSWLYAGYKIAVAEVNGSYMSVNTPEDLQLAQTRWDQMHERHPS